MKLPLVTIVAIVALPALLLPVGVAAAPSAAESASLLVIDASSSVRGEAIEEAMKAARAFAAHRAPAQPLGAIAFNSRRQLLLPLTTDGSAIGEALSSPPTLADGTRLYDAVAAAVAQLHRAGAGAGSVVVFSDGADTGSAASEDTVVREAAAAGVRIFVVGLESASFDPSALRGLARGGEYATATSPRRLEPIFSRFGARLAAPRPERAGGGGFWGSAAAMVTAVLAIALLLGVAVLAAARPRREPLARRLARFGVPEAEPEPQEAPTALRDAGLSGGPLAAVERPLKEKERWRRFEEELDVAQIEMPAIEIVAATVAATLLAMILIAAVAPFALLALFGLLIPPVVRALLDRRVRAVREKFADSLADNLQVVASAIRAGHSMVGALAVLVEEAAEPAREEFRRVVAAERVGVPLEDAIREAARRMANRDMEQLALVAIIQRETGGNTAEIIDRAVETIRERAELRRMMSTLTAQGRLSRGIITALPVVLLIAISALNPDYIAPLFNTAGGQIMLVLAGALIAAGSLAIKRIVDVRV
jgi:tight adherence protein B